MIKFRQKLGKPECPYIVRYVMDFWFFSVRLHHWISSDDQRYFHDHPWWYLTLILKGGYTDISPEGNTVMKAGSWAFHRAEHKHTVLVDKGGCWSLLITGREKRVWGFWIGSKFLKRNKYFFTYGHHPCQK